MKIPGDIKKAIETEYAAWEADLWAGNDKKERQSKGQFATPPPLTLKMLEKFDGLDGTVLDPAMGAGSLLAAAVLAGADPSKVYGIELDGKVLKIARRRLVRLGVPPNNLKQGDALIPESYEFDEEPPKTFIALDKLDGMFEVYIVKDGKLINHAVYRDREKFKNLLKKIAAKKILIQKI